MNLKAIIYSVKLINSNIKNYKYSWYWVKNIATGIKLYAPDFIKKISKIDLNSKEEAKLDALDELGEYIADTRNMIAHVKANYTKKGHECPEKNYEEFSKCLKEVARQVIIWYLKQTKSYLIK